MIRCYLGLGANLNEPYQQLQTCLETLKQHPDITLTGYSSFYRSKPVGPQDQPDYVNAVACIDTDLQPLDLLDALQAIENGQGRVRLRRWGERTLDIDILLVDDQRIDSERLTVPHVEMTNRLFVMLPLAELAPTLMLADGNSVQQHAERLADQDELVIMGRPDI